MAIMPTLNDLFCIISTIPQDALHLVFAKVVPLGAISVCSHSAVAKPESVVEQTHNTFITRLFVFCSLVHRLNIYKFNILFVRYFTDITCLGPSDDDHMHIGGLTIATTKTDKVRGREALRQ